MQSLTNEACGVCSAKYRHHNRKNALVYLRAESIQTPTSPKRLIASLAVDDIAARVAATRQSAVSRPW